MWLERLREVSPITRLNLGIIGKLSTLGKRLKTQQIIARYPACCQLRKTYSESFKNF